MCIRDRTETFSTAADNQTSVEVHVLQGERPMAAQNRTLGKFHLTGIPTAPRGVPQIEVTFDIDANGVLNVSAKERASGKQQSITVSGSTNLDTERIGLSVPLGGQLCPVPPRPADERTT